MIGETTSEEEAKRRIKAMKNCPFLFFGGYSSEIFQYVFIVPEEKKWWLEYPASHPNIIGAEKVTLELVNNVVKPEKVQLVLPEEKSKISPCGSSCEQCPMRLENQCDGCPSTIYSDIDN